MNNKIQDFTKPITNTNIEVLRKEKFNDIANGRDNDWKETLWILVDAWADNPHPDRYKKIEDFVEELKSNQL